jgi:hypothetical protein
MKLTQGLMKALFDYNKETGQLIWKARVGMMGWNTKWAGKPAGSSKGSRAGRPSQTRINGVLYFVHKLVWLYHHGYWADYIDHKNGNNHDNRIENLRECAHFLNLHNRNRLERGVTFNKGKWRARIHYGGKRLHLGYFETREEALAFYKQASKDLYGEFSSYNRSEPHENVDNAVGALPSDAS